MAHTRTSGASLLLLACVVALLACKALKKGEPEPATSAAPAAPSQPSEISFTKSVPKAGTKIAAQRKTVTRFTMNDRVYRETNALDVVLEVQAADEFRVTKAALDVKELYNIKQEGTGSEKKSVSPLEGSRYVVTRSDDGKLSALDASGNKAPAAQLKLIKDEFASAFEKDQSSAFLPDRPLKPGERFSPPSDAVLKMLDIKDDGKTLIDGIEFALATASAERATFDVNLTLTQSIGMGLRLRAKLKGKIDVTPQGAWLVGVDLKGPLELLDSTGKQKGTGELGLTATQTNS
jgi:hypothetical protein